VAFGLKALRSSEGLLVPRVQVSRLTLDSWEGNQLKTAGIEPRDLVVTLGDNLCDFRGNHWG
jgi:hypothetical protein